MSAKRLADEAGKAVFEAEDGRRIRLLLDAGDDGSDILEDFDAWWVHLGHTEGTLEEC